MCVACDVLFRKYVLHVNRYFVSLPYLDIHSNSSSTFMVVGILLNLNRACYNLHMIQKHDKGNNKAEVER